MDIRGRELTNNTDNRDCNALQESLLRANDLNESCTSGMWSRTASGDRGALDHIPMTTHYKWF